MRAMKDSGVDWLGEIPANWDVKRVGSLFRERKQQVSANDYTALSVTKQGVVPQLDSAAKSDATETRKLVREGDFVINSRSDRKGSSGLAPTDGSCSSIYIVLEPKGLEGGFAHQLFRSHAFQEEFYRWGTGIVDDLWSTRYASMKMISVPVPPQGEVASIISYLDQETSQIDLLITKKEQLIEKLLERRQALITQTVTKGLDPRVQMKDSGVSWLGEFPAGWRVAPMWSLARAQAGGTPESSTPEFWDDSSGTPWIAIGDMSGVTEVRETAKAVSELGIASKKLPMGRPGDVLFAMYASVGATSILGISATWNQAILGLRVHDEVAHFRFLSYLLVGVSDVWNLLSNSNTQANLNQHSVMHLRVPLPPKGEQLKIVIHLDQETAQIDTLVEKTRRALEHLKERRQALITKVVTGKLDVRGFSGGNS